MTRVVAAIIRNEEGKILMTRRLSNAKSFPNYWQCLGGKVEEGETDLEALSREVREETGLKVISIGRLASESLITNDVGIECLVRHYEVRVEGRIRHIEVQDHKWMTPVEALDAGLDLCPSEPKALLRFVEWENIAMKQYRILIVADDEFSDNPDTTYTLEEMKSDIEKAVGNLNLKIRRLEVNEVTEAGGEE